MSIVKVFENKEIIVEQDPENGKIYLNIKEVAKILDVATNTILSHMKNHEKEFILNEDYSIIENFEYGRIYKRKVLYPEGFILMTMFVRSEVAARARKWAKRTLVKHIANMQQQNPLLALKDVVDQLILQDERHKVLENKVELIDSKYDEKFQILEEEKQNSAVSNKDAYFIKGLIEDIAYYLARLKGQDRPDKKQFSFVYAKFKKRYEIPKYSMLAQKDYDGAVRFLIGWRDDLMERFN